MLLGHCLACFLRWFFFLLRLHYFAILFNIEQLLQSLLIMSACHQQNTFVSALVGFAFQLTVILQPAAALKELIESCPVKWHHLGIEEERFLILSALKTGRKKDLKRQKKPQNNKTLIRRLNFYGWVQQTTTSSLIWGDFLPATRCKTNQFL